MGTGKGIRIAGLGMGWSLAYAMAYKDRLIDFGFTARVLQDAPQEGVLVAYSVRNFSRSEAEGLLSGLCRENRPAAPPKGDGDEDESGCAG